MKGNQRQRLDCPYCWSVLFSKSALTAHINKFHSKTRAKDEFLMAQEGKND